MSRRPAPARPLRTLSAPPGLALAFLVPVLLLNGCSGDDPAVPPEAATPAGPAPVLEAEPAYTPGTTNTVTWTVPAGDKTGEPEFLVQRSVDPLFAEPEDDSGWISESSHRFTDLEHGRTHFFRVRGRSSRGTETPWSGIRSSTQDASPPTAAIAALKAEQTSLLFTFILAGTDQVSGVAGIELWFEYDGAAPRLHGVFPPGEVSFRAAGGGMHLFTAVAVDAAGNRQDPATAVRLETLVPEPIIIVDRNGEEFDITAAVLEYRMGEQYWEFGLGRHTIRPVIDPLMIGPGQVGYPADDNTTEIVGVAYGDDVRAYKIGDLPDREVVDDVVNGIPIAVCY